MRLAHLVSVACVFCLFAADAIAVLDDRPTAEWTTIAAWAVASDPDASEADREGALGLLGRSPGQADPERALLANFFRSGVSTRLQVAAVKAMARGGEPKAPQTLLVAWNALGPEARSAVLDALLSRDDWAGALLSSLEETCVPPSDVGPKHRKSFLGLRNGALRERASVVFGEEQDGGDRGVAVSR